MENPTVVFAVILCIAGFLLGFLAVYTTRRRRIMPKTTSQVVTNNTEQTPCPWCGKKGYSAANPTFTCPKCGTIHHRPCWEEYGGCTTWECPLAPVGEEAKEEVA